MGPKTAKITPPVSPDSQKEIPKEDIPIIEEEEQINIKDIPF